MMLEIIVAIVVFIPLFLIGWKTFDYFQMTLVDAATMTGFDYHFKKFSTGVIVGWIGAYFVTAYFFGESKEKSVIPTSKVSASNYSEPKPSQQSQQIKRHVESIPQQISYTKEQVWEMEEKVQYHGDDPLIRNRLGLPPTPASQY